jgi:CheY-like chemotaxis protein
MEAAREPAVPSGAAAEQSLGCVLLVDDDELVRGTLAEQLRTAAFVIVQAGAALARLNEHPDVMLLLTDLSMPRMNGLSLIRELHRIRPLPPAILLTGFAGYYLAGRRRRCQSILFADAKAGVGTFADRPDCGDAGSGTRGFEARRRKRLLSRAFTRIGSRAAFREASTLCSKCGASSVPKSHRRDPQRRIEPAR